MILNLINMLCRGATVQWTMITKRRKSTGIPSLKYKERKRKMQRTIINENKSAFEFKRIVNHRANELIKKGFILIRIKYKRDKETNRYKQAIIEYKARAVY